MKKSLLNYLLIILISVSIIYTSEAREQSISNFGYAINDTTQYATLYIYRPANSVGGLVGYNINVNDSTVVKIKNNSKAAIKLYQEGPVQLSVGNEDKKMKVDIQFGEVYYLKFAMLSGLVGARPEINLISPSQGEAEYSSIKDKKSKSKIN